MKPFVLACLAACAGAASQPASPQQPDPTLGSSPPSQPVGEPIEVHPLPPVVGSLETWTLATDELLEIRVAGGGKHQSTEERLRVRVKVLAVDAAHGRATQLEVTTEDATRTLRVDTAREVSAPLEGVYIATRGAGADHMVATNRDGTGVMPREQSALDSLVGELFERDDTLELLVEHPLRLGETVPIVMDLREDLHTEPATSRATLSLRAATASSATYELDLAATAHEPNVLGEIDLRGRITVVLDRAHGRIVDRELVTYKTERAGAGGRATDTLDKERKQVTVAP